MKLHITLAKVPRTQALILRQTLASLSASTLRSYERNVISEELSAEKIRFFGGSAREAPGYIYPNGSKLVVGGLDKPGKVLSTEFTRIAVDEADQISLTAYQTLLTRLRGESGTYKQIVLCCNPASPDHWAKKRAESGELTHLYSHHTENPYLFDRAGNPTSDGTEYLARLDTLSGVMRARYRDGRWVSAEGVVYPDWNPAVHVIDRFEIPKEWPLMISIDWGHTHPLIMQFWRIDGDGRMYLTREWNQTGTLVEDAAKAALRIIADEGMPRPYAIAADHDAEDRHTFEKHSGFTTRPAYKAVSRGLQLVSARLRVAADGKPRLMVFRDAVVGRDPGAPVERPRGVAEEAGGYVWQTSRDGTGVPKEAPVKNEDDSMDCMRYGVAMIDKSEPGRIGNPAAPRTEAAPQQGGRWSQPVGR